MTDVNNFWPLSNWVANYLGVSFYNRRPLICFLNLVSNLLHYTPVMCTLDGRVIKLKKNLWLKLSQSVDKTDLLFAKKLENDFCNTQSWRVATEQNNTHTFQQDRKQSFFTFPITNCNFVNFLYKFSFTFNFLIVNLLKRCIVKIISDKGKFIDLARVFTLAITPPPHTHTHSRACTFTNAHKRSYSGLSLSCCHYTKIFKMVLVTHQMAKSFYLIRKNLKAFSNINFWTLYIDIYQDLLLSIQILACSHLVLISIKFVHIHAFSLGWAFRGTSAVFFNRLCVRFLSDPNKIDLFDKLNIIRLNG